MMDEDTDCIKVLEALYTPEDVKYYVEIFGFNPILDAQILNSNLENRPFYNWLLNLNEKRNVPYKYESWFNTPIDFAGITIRIGAVVTVYFGQPKNSIVLSYNDKNASVYCVHTAIMQFSAADLVNNVINEEDIIEHAKSSEFLPLNIKPAEHFISLKSYVQGIAEMGIDKLIISSYASDTVNPFTLPFGFNSLMQSQFINALKDILPAQIYNNIILNILSEIAHSVPREWFNSHTFLLNNVYNIKELAQDQTGLKVLNDIQRETGSENLLKLLTKNTNMNDFEQLIQEHTTLFSTLLTRLWLTDSHYLYPKRTYKDYTEKEIQPKLKLLTDVHIYKPFSSTILIDEGLHVNGSPSNEMKYDKQSIEKSKFNFKHIIKTEQEQSHTIKSRYLNIDLQKQKMYHKKSKYLSQYYKH